MLRCVKCVGLTPMPSRDGATPIDLINGEELAEKLKELRLGIRTEMVENVEVDADWFRNI